MMTLPEVTRLVCYFVGAPIFLILASDNFSNRKRVEGVRDLGISLVFLWYMIEITMISSGINTREYRVIGTPTIMAITAAGVLIAVPVIKSYFRGVKSRWGKRVNASH